MLSHHIEISIMDILTPTIWDEATPPTPEKKSHLWQAIQTAKGDAANSKDAERQTNSKGVHTTCNHNQRHHQQTNLNQYTQS